MRLRALAAACGLFLLAGCSVQPAAQIDAAVAPAPAARTEQRVPATVEDLQKRTFDFFWERANPANGLVPDRWPTPSFSSIAAVGFGLTTYGIGVERGWITRNAAAGRTLATLQFFAGAPQGPQAAGTAGHEGFFYHFLEMDSGLRSGTNELSSVDTALLLAGVLFAQSYFDRADPREARIRELAEAIYRRVDWTFLQARPPLISMGWSPEEGVIPHDWEGYNEALLVYVLALASPTHPVQPDAYQAWLATYDRSWTELHGQRFLSFPPLFGHQYSHAWIDFRGIADDWVRGSGIDYFENSRRAAHAHRNYAIANPRGWTGYGEDIWGLTACDGPIDAVLPFKGERRKFQTYTARGVGKEYTVDDGTIAPTAAAASIAFAPEIAIPAIEAMRKRYGDALYGQYGFLDAFNPSFTDARARLRHGKVVDGIGWVDTDYLGIDQGAIILMIENHRSGLVWEMMRRNPHIRNGLQRAGFRGGWLDAAPKAG